MLLLAERKKKKTFSISSSRAFPPMDAGPELATAAVQFAAHGLFEAARWAAEQAASLGVPLLDMTPDARCIYPLSLLATQNYAMASEAAAEAAMQGSSEARFIELYALWLDGEARRVGVETEEPGMPPRNAFAQQLLLKLHDRPLNALSGPEAYLLGLVYTTTTTATTTITPSLQHQHQQQRSQARAAFLHAVRCSPCLLPAWEELVKLATQESGRPQHVAVQHWMAELFAAHVSLRLHPDAALAHCTVLAARFPRSPYFAAQVAAAHCARRDLERAARAFEALLATHTRRLQELHLYSDVLYVMEDRARLGWLARHAHSIDAFRAETQCVLGNLHALHGRHEAAIGCFQRVLRLRAEWGDTWVLRGHEHLELKQTGAAVYAYRRTLAAHGNECHAWYGLGQAYELLKMHARSLHYYRRAAQLRPRDPRMWCAVASGLEALGLRHEAVRAYSRADESEARDSLALARLASLHAELGNTEQAAYYNKRHLDRRDEEQDDSQPTLEALLFLAQHCKSRARYTEAAAYCSRLLDYPGREKEEAKALLREIHSLQSDEPITTSCC